MIEILKVQEIVREAAKIFSNRNAAEQIKQKGVFDYVTAIDEAVQEFIQKELSDLYPQIQFMGEEKDNSDIDMSGQVWVLDIWIISSSGIFWISRIINKVNTLKGINRHITKRKDEGILRVENI